MVLIFDEASTETGAFSLCVDCLLSLVRQWVLRSGLWKLAAAILGACVQIVVSSAICVTLLHNNGRGLVLREVPRRGAVLLSDLMQLTVWSVGAVVLVVIAATVWVKRLNVKRIEP